MRVRADAISVALATGRRTALALLLGCGQGIAPAPGTQPPAPATTACAPNPYDACYPSGAGVAVGDRIPDLCFDLPTHTCLSQLYDPAQELKGKLLLINACAVWAGPCNEVTDLITGSNASGANVNGTSLQKELGPLGVVFAQYMEDDSVVGTGPTIADLAGWVAAHDAQTVYEADDPEANLGAFFSVAAIPLNIVVDLRSMEILAINVGFDPSMDATLRAWLQWVATHPPMTPLPTSP